MPISKEDFLSAQKKDPLTTLINRFLVSNQSQAYNIDEIMEAVEPGTEKKAMDLEIFLIALAILRHAGSVDGRVITNASNEKEIYFRATNPTQ